MKPLSFRFSSLGALLLVGLLGVGCSPASTGDPGLPASGGAPGNTNSGGSSAKGGSTAQGGSSGGDTGGAGGSSSTGGTSGGTGGTSGGTGGSGAGGSGNTGGSGDASGGSSGAGDAGSSGGSSGSADASGGGGGSKDVLFVGTGKDAIDASLLMGLKAKGFTVTMAPDTAPASMATGKGLIIISPSSSRANLKTTFKDVAVPLIIMKDGAMQMLGMTGGDIVTPPGGKQITITMADSPLAAGKTGMITVYSNSDRLFAGTMLGPDAIKVATLVTQATQWAIFAYPSGGMMVGTKAPAKRVGFFAHQDGTLSPDGLALFEAAIDWATSP